MNGDFHIKNYSFESFVCATLLTLASFSILPLSLSIENRESASEWSAVKVYTRQDSSDMEKREKTAKKISPIARLPESSISAVTETYCVPKLDFSSVAIGEPDLSANGDFSLSMFGSNVGDFSGGEITIFELDTLDKIPRRLNSVRVNYPRDLLRRGVEGEVKLNVIIDERGAVEVESVESSSDKKFESAAIKAAANLKYEVPTRNGKAVRARFVLPIPFKILK